MESYTLIFVRDQHARPVQIAIPKIRVKQAVATAFACVLVAGIVAWDYWRLRADNAELADLRVEALEQREQIATFRTRLSSVDEEIAKVVELERKVRIIANLPGAAGVGGDDVTELAPEGQPVGTPVGVPVEPPEGMGGQGGGQPLPEIGVDVSGIQVLESSTVRRPRSRRTRAIAPCPSKVCSRSSRTSASDSSRCPRSGPRRAGSPRASVRASRPSRAAVRCTPGSTSPPRAARRSTRRPGAA